MKRASEPVPRGELAALALLTALVAATFPYAALIVDSGRDLAWGWSIAQGHAWPVYGPGLNGIWQPGPAWFYLLGLALAVSGSIGGTTLLVGLLAALKVPLAYALGRSWCMLQPRPAGAAGALGLGLAAAVALPGWNTVGQLVLSHTSLVETGVLATLWLALLAWRERRVAPLALASLALGLAMHAHPTALVAAPAVGLAGWRVARARGAWVTLAVGAAALALPFVPALLAEARSGWPQLDASGGYFGQSDYLARALRAPAVLQGASVGSVAFVRDFLLGRWPGLALVAGAALVVVYLLALPGLLLACLRRERAAWLALALASWAWSFVLLLRDTTPVWMIYACAPFDAALVAVGWQAVWRGTWPRAAAWCLTACAVAISGALLADRVFATRAGVQWFPSAALGDIAQPPHRDPPLRFWLPGYGHDALARKLCAEARPLALHGDLATALHFGQGVALALHCETQTVRLGGAAPRQLAGVPRAIATALQLAGVDTPWGYVLLEPAASLHPARGDAVQVHTRYLMDDYRRRAAGGPTRIALDAPCSPRDLLVVTNLAPGLNAPFSLQARAGHALPTAVSETIASRYFDCPASGHFALELDTLDPQAADVFMLRRD